MASVFVSLSRSLCLFTNLPIPSTFLFRIYGGGAFLPSLTAKEESHALEVRALEDRVVREAKAASEGAEQQVTIWRAKATAAEERATEALTSRALSESRAREGLEREGRRLKTLHEESLKGVLSRADEKVKKLEAQREADRQEFQKHEQETRARVEKVSSVPGTCCAAKQ